MPVYIRKEWFGGLIGDTISYSLKAINKTTYSNLVEFFQNNFFPENVRWELLSSGIDIDSNEVHIFNELTKNQIESKRLTAPIISWLEITSKCNLTCTHCFNKRILSSKNQSGRILKTIKELSEKGVFKITLTGGEPLLCDNLNQYLEALNISGIGVRVFTSGVVKRKAFESISDYDIDILYFSLDGSKISNDTLRGKGSYDAILKNLKYVSEKMKMVKEIVFSVTLHKMTDTTLNDLFLTAREFGIKSILFRPLFLYSWMDDVSKNKVLSKDELIRILFKIQELSKKFGIEYQLNKLPYLMNGKDVYYFDSPNNISLDSLVNVNSQSCVAGNIISGIKYDGSIMPCGFSNIDFDSTESYSSKGDFHKWWNKSPNNEILKKAHQNTICKNCLLFFLCRGGGCNNLSCSGLGPMDRYCLLFDTVYGKKISRTQTQKLLEKSKIDLDYISKEREHLESDSFHIPTHNIVSKCGCPK